MTRRFVKLRWALAASAALGAARPAAALQPVEAFLRGARTYAPENAQARAEAERQRNLAGVARGRVLPGVAVTGTYARNQYETTAVVPSLGGGPASVVTITPKDELTGAASITVPLVDLTGFALASAARSAAGAADAQAQAQALQIESLVAQDYYQLLANAALADAARRAVEVARVSLQIAQQRREAGSASLLEVDRARAELESDVQQVAGADLQVAIVARALESLSGVQPELDPEAPAEQLQDDLHDEPPLERFQSPDERLPAVVAASLTRASAESQATAQQLVLVPRVAASIAEQVNNAGAYAGHDAAWIAQVGFTWAFDLATLPAIRAQEAGAESARQAERRAKLSARDAIHDAWHTVASGIARSRSARAQSQASAEAATQALQRYRAGTATQLDLLQAQRDALGAEASRIQADAGLLNARRQLRLAAGESLTGPG